jgi:hypothetical protein
MAQHHDDEEDGEPGGASSQAAEVDDATQIWEHVKTLRKRVAGFN